MRKISVAVLGLVLIGVTLSIWNAKLKADQVPLFRIYNVLDIDSTNSLDPIDVHLISEVNILENIMAPLVSYDQDGVIVSDLARVFEWQGDTLYLRLRDDYRTIDGYSVTARDVIFSLRRAFVSREYKDFDLEGIICGENIGDCPGLTEVDDYTVAISPQIGRHFLLSLLSTHNFLIMREAQVNDENVIVDYRNTTGAYYFENHEVDAEYHLKANPNHWRYKKNMPQVVKFIFKEKQGDAFDPFEAFVNGEIDFLLATVSRMGGRYIAAAEKLSIPYHRTYGLIKFLVAFTYYGKEKLTQEERHWVGNYIRDAMVPHLNRSVGEVATEHFFSELGSGGLTPAQDAELKYLKANAKKPNVEVRLSLYTSFNRKPLPPIAVGLKEMDEVKVTYDAEDHDFSRAIDVYPDDYPHVTIIMNTSSWDDSIAFIAYNWKEGRFSDRPVADANFLLDYLSMETKEAQNEVLRNLHFQALASPTLVPVADMAFFEVINPHWTAKHSPYSPAFYLWSMEAQ